MRIAAVVAIFLTAGIAWGGNARQQEYNGVCEASAAVPIGGNHFAVATDEANVITIYRKDVATPVSTVDVEPFTGFDASDIEGAARVGQRVYWISSHSYNKDGKDRPKRRVFFGTDIRDAMGRPTLHPVGKAYRDLRDPLAVFAGVAKDELNIEGLAAAGEGGLFIALRAPVQGGQALVVPLLNPADVIERAAEPRFGAVIALNLNGRGIRSLERVGTGDRAYLIVAGPVNDENHPFQLHWWSGNESDRSPRPVTDVSFDGLTPEALFLFERERALYVLSDDGSVCSDEGPYEQRRFRVRELLLPELAIQGK